MQRSSPPVVSEFAARGSHSRQARQAWASQAERSGGGVFTKWWPAHVQPMPVPSVLLALAAGRSWSVDVGKRG